MTKRTQGCHTKKYILTVEGSFDVSCTLDTCVDVIRKHLF